MTNWSPDQNKVIQSEARELICSAAAGSGKTAVLVERIFRLLSRGVNPESFLIITFTNAAASEMRERIRIRLFQNRNSPEIRKALDQMDLMHISTIHSFCQVLIKNEFQTLELDPLFGICDSAQREAFFHEAFLEACEETDASEKENPEYIRFRRSYDVRTAEKLVKNLHEYIMSMPDPYQWLEQKIREIPEKSDRNHPWFKSLQKMAEDHIYAAETILNEEYKMLQDDYALEQYRETWKADAELFHVKQSWLKNPEQTSSLCKFSNLKPVRGLNIFESDWKERYQAARNRFKTEMSAADSLILINDDKVISEWSEIEKMLNQLRNLTVATGKHFQNLKRKKGLVDFSDLEQYALEILKTPASRENIQKSVRYIFVDECQDVSAVQDAIIQNMHCSENDLFMVGDVKQSIYRFRLADPLIFLNRIDQYEKSGNKDRECIFLRENFRSRPEILETANTVFRDIMKKEITEMDYSKREELVSGRKTDGYDPVCVDLLNNDRKEYPDLSAVADHLACQMTELTEQKFPGEERNYIWRDMVILMPAVSGKGARLAELLKLRDIPVFFDGDGFYYQQPEIMKFRAILDLLVNPRQDIPLLTVLKISPFSFSEEELGKIRLSESGKNIPFFDAFEKCAAEKTETGIRCAFVQKKIRQWKMMSESLCLSDLIWYLYQETGYYDLLSAEKDGAIRQANLRMLCEQASEAEKNGISSLRDFTAILQNRQANGDRQNATLLGEKDNLVRIMTIHKSKGLQFPAVFCVGMDDSPEGRDQSDIRIHQELGITLSYKDPDHRISRPTLADEIFSWRKERDEKAEKVRLLYVAMTRAQERLFLVTCKVQDPLWSMPAGEYRISAAKTYADWFMPALMDKKLSTGYSQGSTPWKIRLFESNQQRIVEKRKDIHNIRGWLNPVLSAQTVDDLWKKEDPEEQKNETVVKRSVTALIRSARHQIPEEDEEETMEKKRIPDAISRRLKESEIQKMPAFMSKKDKTEGVHRGTVMHLMLALVDLDLIRNTENVMDAIAAEKNRMTVDGILTPEEASKLDDRKVADFFSSVLGKRMLFSEEIRREWNFNLHLKEKRNILLQGVIDCAFREKNDWVIVDYKTDTISSENDFIEEYRPQLMWYAEALKKLTGQKVKEIYLYSLYLSRAIRLNGEMSESGKKILIGGKSELSTGMQGLK